MLCEICKVNEAMIYVKKYIEGEITSIGMCFECAKNEKKVNFANNITLEELINGLVSMTKESINEMKKEEDKYKDVQCKVCGMKYLDVLKSGKVGCMECYNFMKPQLLKRINRKLTNTKYYGDIPKNYDLDFDEHFLLRKYKIKLKDALEKENYYDAAKYRDLIKDLEYKNG